MFRLRHGLVLVVAAVVIAVAAAATEAKPPRATAARACAAGKANVPDGPGPLGGCFPGPSNTGVPKGISLSRYRGPCRITTARKVIRRKLVNCHRLEIAARGVAIWNSRINGSVQVERPHSVTVVDSTIDAGEVN